MNQNAIRLSTAYFPPVTYFSLIIAAGKVLIEDWENYLKQTYRNRCRIYSANGPVSLSVPVLEGSVRKTFIRDIRIDYSKRWQAIHLRALESAYRSSPFFQYYFEEVCEVIYGNYVFLKDLNAASLGLSTKILGIKTPIGYTPAFERPEGAPYDFRYTLSPKNHGRMESFSFSEYPQTFSEKYGFLPELSVLDLIFNMGPASIDILINTRFIK